MADYPMQHGRTHCPGGSDPIPAACLSGSVWPWVVLENLGQTLATGTSFIPSYLTNVYWDATLTEDPTVGGGIFSVSSVTHSGTDYWRLLLNNEGWYLFEMWHSIDDVTGWAAGEYFQQRISQTAGTPFQSDDRLDSSISEELINGNQQSTETFRLIWAAQSDTQRAYEATIRQTSGVDKSVGGNVKVWYLGGVGGSTASSSWSTAAA